MYFQLSESVLKLLAIDIADLNALLYRGSGGNSGGGADTDADRHHAIVRVSDVSTGNISAREQNSVNSFGYEASVRNCVSFRLSPVLLYTCSVEPGTGHVVNVEVEVRAADDPVVEATFAVNISFSFNVYTPLKCLVSRTPIIDPALIM